LPPNSGDPASEDNPCHAGLELWVAAYGHQIVGKPAGWFDRCQDGGDRPSSASSPVTQSIL